MMRVRPTRFPFHAISDLMFLRQTDLLSPSRARLSLSLSSISTGRRKVSENSIILRSKIIRRLAVQRSIPEYMSRRYSFLALERVDYDTRGGVMDESCSSFLSSIRLVYPTRSRKQLPWREITVIDASRGICFTIFTDTGFLIGLPRDIRTVRDEVRSGRARLYRRERERSSRGFEK